jgi:uncharacterized protein
LSKIQAMKNIVGQTPRGTDCYPRTPIVSKIYRRLDSGDNLYLSAPRRSGKTSIMRSLEDTPREGYVFLYLNVEDCADSEDYFRILAEELEKSAAQGKWAKLGEKAQGVFKNFLDRVKKVKISIIEVETGGSSKKPLSYAEAFEELLRDLDTEEQKIVVMVDEFPVAIENIAKKHGNEAAVTFLHANRGMRQRAGKGIRFIYTGSIGLPNVARKLDPSPTINDLNIVEIPPLTEAEGLDMSKKILAEYGVGAAEEVVEYLLERLDWLMPFSVQLMLQILIDEAENTGQPVSKAMVETALDKAASHRNNIYWANYFDRLKEAFSEAEYWTAKAILSEIARLESVPAHDFKQSNAAEVLEVLEYDGYIHETSGQYQFNSVILRKWWQKNAR